MQGLCPFVIPPPPHQTKVFDQWHSFVENYEISCDEFYKKVEKELEARKIPGLYVSRATWAEGGALSANREYLRLTREKWAFDICAAPFGTGYFFSYRFTEAPVRINIIALFLFFFVLVETYKLITAGALQTLTSFSGMLLIICLGVSLSWFFGNVGEFKTSNFDMALLRLPIIGRLYDRFLRKETYYREDTRLMYLATVPAVVKKLVEEVTVSKGVTRPTTQTAKPMLAELAGVA